MTQPNKVTIRYRGYDRYKDSWKALVRAEKNDHIVELRAWIPAWDVAAMESEHRARVLWELDRKCP